MVQVDEGPWLACKESPSTPGLYTAPWTPDLLDDTSGLVDHELKVFVSDRNGRSRSLTQPFRIDMENLGKTTGLKVANKMKLLGSKDKMVAQNGKKHLLF